MSKHYHRPLSREDEASIHILNNRFSQLDRAIRSLYTEQDVRAEAGEALSARDTAFLDLSDGLIYRMDSNDAAPKAGRIRGFIDAAVSMGQVARLVISGTLSGFTALTPFQKLYVGTSPGSYTQTKPEASLGAGQIMIAAMGYAISTTEIVIKPERIAYHLRDAMAQNDILSIVHHADARGFKRGIRANLLDEDAGAVIASYASSNQDSNVALSDATIATYTADLCTGGTPLGNMTASGGLVAAFDNSAATAAQNAGSTGTIGYDFGIGITKAIRQYTIQHSASLAVTQAPQAWTFQYSNDNSNWTTVDTRTSQTGWSLSEKRTYQFASSVSARYWRINISNNNGAANTSVGEVEMMEVATYTNGASKLTQLFNLASTQTIATLDLWLKKVGSPTGTVTVRIETVSGGNPTGTLAHANASATFSESTLSSGYAAQLVSFTSFSLNSGDYAIVISTSRSASETDYIHWGSDASAPSYAGGEMKSYNGVSWSALSMDGIFTIYDEAVSYSSTVRVSNWSSSFAALGSRYGDENGDTPETETSFKCLRASGLNDVTLCVEME